MGKTWLALSIAQAVSQGGNLGPWQAPESASVLYVDGEMHPNDLQSAIAKVARGQGNSDTLTFDVLCAKKTEFGIINLLDPDWQKEIEKRAKQKSLVIFDTFYSLTRNIATEFMEILAFLQKLRTQGCAILVIDHNNRDGILQGSSNKGRGAETLVELRVPDGRDRREKFRAVEVIESRHKPLEAAEYFVGEMVFTEDSFRFEVDTSEVPAEPEPIPDEVILPALVKIARDDDKLSYPRICERFGIATSTANDWYKKLENLTGPGRDTLNQELARLRAKRVQSEEAFWAEVNPALKRYSERKDERKEKS